MDIPRNGWLSGCVGREIWRCRCIIEGTVSCDVLVLFIPGLTLTPRRRSHEENITVALPSTQSEGLSTVFTRIPHRTRRKIHESSNLDCQPPFL